MIRTTFGFADAMLAKAMAAKVIDKHFIITGIYRLIRSKFSRESASKAYK
jgi:hypothetical protein